MTDNTQVATTEARAPTKLSDDLAMLRPEIEKVLPSHVTPERFIRVVTTAIASSPQLARADRRSLLTSAIKCAQDGLVPDGREAAFVVFYDKKLKKDKVQYLPMLAGVLKKIRNSGELLSIACNVVCQADSWRYWIDDNGEHILHEPAITAETRGRVIAAYAVARTRDDGVYTEVMSRADIDKVRAISKAKDGGPWVEWFDEMARKTVIRRLAKRLPMSTDIDGLIRRDDELVDEEALSGGDRTLARPPGGNAAVRGALGISIEDEPEHEPDEPSPQLDIEGAIEGEKSTAAP
jgi:recombination protein RecT